MTERERWRETERERGRQGKESLGEVIHACHTDEVPPCTPKSFINTLATMLQTFTALLTMSRPVARPWTSALAAMKALDT